MAGSVAGESLSPGGGETDLQKLLSSLAPAVDARRFSFVLATGVTREMIRDAMYVAFLFNTYDRLADTLGWELPDQSFYPKAGKFLLKKGYQL